ncbi:hypothetical protein D3C81_900920 [compost metagenome]
MVSKKKLLDKLREKARMVETERRVTPDPDREAMCEAELKILKYVIQQTESGEFDEV